MRDAHSHIESHGFAMRQGARYIVRRQGHENVLAFVHTHHVEFLT